MNPNKLALLLSYIFIMLALWQALEIGKLSKEKQIHKIDYAEINSIKYGLMNIDQWKEKLSYIFERKISNLNITSSNKGIFQNQIEGFLHQGLDEVEGRFRDKIRKAGLGGKIAGTAIRNKVDVNKLRREIPTYASMILDKLEDDANMDEIKQLVVKQFETYLTSTVQEKDYSKLDALKLKYETSNIKDCSSIISTKIMEIDSVIWRNVITLIICGLLIFSFWYFLPNRYNYSFNLYSLLGILCIFLFIGVTTPMIDIDARIQSLSFLLAGEPIQFSDQILFFQSKSILEVVQLMLANERFDTLLVGIMIFMFSIIFPISKLIAGILIIRNPNLTEISNLMNFLAFKSGKWVMADVTVIAIFMSYIGFQGVISNQLQQLETSDVITTNETSLQVGFIVFTLFCLGSLFLSQEIEKYTNSILEN